MSKEKIVILRNYPACPCGKRLRARQKKYCSYTCKNKYTIQKKSDKALRDDWINFEDVK